MVRRQSDSDYHQTRDRLQMERRHMLARRMGYHRTPTALKVRSLHTVLQVLQDRRKAHFTPRSRIHNRVYHGRRRYRRRSSGLRKSVLRLRAVREICHPHLDR